MEVYGIYFSPTGTSKKNVMSIMEGIDENTHCIDITVPGLPNKTTFTKEDVVVFGGPVYGGRLFKEQVKRMQIFKGNQTPCIITVTYGNRDYDDALIEMFDVVSTLGFIPIAGAGMVAKHTYGHIQEHRPDQKDLADNQNFGKNVKAKIKAKQYDLVNIPGHRPYKDGGNGGHFIPTSKHTICTKCGMCAKLCPMQAISHEDFTIDPNTCISCFRCIQVCPVQAKVMEGKEYIEFASMFTKKLATPKENQYFI